jgi:hypothetical protein
VNLGTFWNVKIKYFKLFRIAFQDIFLSEERITEICHNLQRHSNLIELTFEDICLRGNAMKNISQLICVTHNLRHLGLINTQMEDRGGSLVFESLSRNKSLKLLQMGGNNLKSCPNLGDALAVNATLTELCLMRNTINLEGYFKSTPFHSGKTIRFFCDLNLSQFSQLFTFSNFRKKLTSKSWRFHFLSDVEASRPRLNDLTNKHLRIESTLHWISGARGQNVVPRCSSIFNLQLETIINNTST